MLKLLLTIACSVLALNTKSDSHRRVIRRVIRRPAYGGAHVYSPVVVAPPLVVGGGIMPHYGMHYGYGGYGIQHTAMCPSGCMINGFCGTVEQCQAFAHHRNTSMIIGVVVAVVFLIVIAIMLCVFCQSEPYEQEEVEYREVTYV